MKRSSVARSAARAGVRLIDRALGLDVRNPMGAVARPAPEIARYWYLNPGAWVVLLLIATYQYMVPVARRRVCRFEPSCSSYTTLAIRKYGLWAGTRRGLLRFRRCTGFVPGGVDPP